VPHSHARTDAIRDRRQTVRAALRREAAAHTALNPIAGAHIYPILRAWYAQFTEQYANLIEGIKAT
jgi:hypothetical protein